MSLPIFIPNGVLVIISRFKDKIISLKSLRVQSATVLILLGIVPLVLFSFVLLTSYRSRMIDNKIAEYKTRGAIISNLVLSSAYFSNDITKEVDSEITQVSDIYDGRIIVCDASLNVLRDTYGLNEGKLLILPEVIDIINGDSGNIVNEELDYVHMYMPIYGADKQSVNGVLVMSYSLNDVNRLYSTIRTIVLTILLLLCVFIMILSIIYSGRIVKPLKEVSSSIVGITSGDFNEKVDLKGCLEIENVSNCINEMIADLQNLEDARQEFVSNVSHELKTPITSVKVLAESLTAQEDTPVEIYREFMVDINSELERMNKIINDLLSLVRMDKNADAVSITDVNINEFVESILKQLRPIAELRNIDIVFESARPVSAKIDEVKLGMAFRNLIENAIKYNYENGWVRVSLNADHKFFYLKVSDGGVGIPEELQDNIFERFYRVDKARSRETGGNGLGLAITRTAILLHRGSIKVHSVVEEGTTFNVRIPLNYLE